MGDGYKGMRIKDDTSNWWTSMVRNQGRDPLVQIVKSDNPLKTFAKLHIPGTDEAEQGMLRFLDPDGGLAQRKMYKDGEWIDEADYDRIRDARAKQKFFEKMDQQRAQRQSGYNMGYGYASGGPVAPGKGGSMGMGGGYARPAVMPQQNMARPAVMPQQQDFQMKSAVLPNQPQRPAVMPGGGTISPLPDKMQQGIGSLTGGLSPMPQRSDLAYAGGSPNFDESAGSQTIGQPMPAPTNPAGQQLQFQNQLRSMHGQMPQAPTSAQPAMNWQQRLMAQKQATPPPPPGYNGTGPGYHGPGMGVMGGAPTGPWAQPQPGQGSPGKGGGMRQMPAQPPQASPGKGGRPAPQMPQQEPNMGNRGDFMRGRPAPSTGGPQPVGGKGGQSPAYGSRSRMSGARPPMGGKGGG